MDRHYEIKYKHNEYTWPTEAVVTRLSFDEQYMHMHMADGRIMSVPLAWIPTLANAPQEARENYYLSYNGHTAHWDPDEGPINEDLWLPSFLRYDEPEH